MSDKPTPWEVYWKAQGLTETQMKAIVIIIDELLKSKEVSSGNNRAES